MKQTFFPRLWVTIIFLLLFLSAGIAADAAIYLYLDGSSNSMIAFEVNGNRVKRKNKKSTQTIKVFSRCSFIKKASKGGHFFSPLIPQISSGKISQLGMYGYGNGKLVAQNERWTFLSSGRYRQAVCKNTSGKLLERYLLTPRLAIYPLPAIISKMDSQSFYLVNGSKILPISKKKAAAGSVSLLNQGQTLAEISYNKRGIATAINFASGDRLILSSSHPGLRNPQYREVLLKPEYFSPYFDPRDKQISLDKKPVLQEGKKNLATYQRDVTVLYDVTDDFVELVRKESGQWVRSSPKALDYIDFIVDGSRVTARINNHCKMKYFNNEPLIVKKKKELVELKKKEMGAEFDGLSFEDSKWELNWLNAWKTGYMKLQAHLDYVLVEKKTESKTFNIIPLLEKKFISTFGKATYNHGNAFEVTRDKNYVYYIRKKRNLFGPDKDVGTDAYDIDVLGLKLINDARDRIENAIYYSKAKFTLDYSNTTLTATYTVRRRKSGSLTVELDPVDDLRQDFGFIPPVVKLDKVFNGVWLTGDGECSWDYQRLFMEMLQKVDFSRLNKLNCFGDNKLFSRRGRLYIQKKCSVYQPVHKKIITKAIKRFKRCVVLDDEDYECSFIKGKIQCRFWGGEIGR